MTRPHLYVLMCALHFSRVLTNLSLRPDSKPFVGLVNEYVGISALAVTRFARESHLIFNAASNARLQVEF